MKKFVYWFNTLSAFVEQNTWLKVAPGGKITGLNLRSTLRYQFGAGAQRFHPLGVLMILPEPTPPFPYHELSEDADREPDWPPDLILR